MRKIIIKEARLGMRVGREISAAGAHLATAGDEVTSTLLIRMHEQGIYDLWVTEPAMEFLEDLPAAQPTTAQRRLAESLAQSFHRFQAIGGAPLRALIKRHSVAIANLLTSLIKSASAIPCFNNLTEDESLLSHSTDVCVLSILLGTQLEDYITTQRRRMNGRPARDLINLALGSLFHDIGELMLPDSQRESHLNATPRDNGENSEWKQHTDEGYAMVRGRLDPTAAAIVLHHHQHFDGSGFSGNEAGLRVQSGCAIHIYARIATAADLFCQALSAGSGSGGRIAQPVVRALWQIQNTSTRSRIDPVVLEALVGLLPALTEGMLITLSNGRRALVTRVDNPADRRPEVYLLPSMSAMPDHLEDAQPASGELQLAKSNLEIKDIEGWDVSAFFHSTHGHPAAAA